MDLKWTWQEAATCAELWTTLVNNKEHFPSDFLEKIGDDKVVTIANKE